jgi:hypothetical protein
VSSSQADLHRALRLAPHASRIVLVLAAILLARIGSRYIIDPAGALKPDGIAVLSEHATTVARVGLGAFPLAIAIYALGSVLVSRALMAATSLIAVVMATALVVRITEIVGHGGIAGNPGPLIGESVFLVLSSVALVWNVASRRLP